VGESLITGANPLSIVSPDGPEIISWLFVEVSMNNEEGVLKDVERIGRYCTKYGTVPVTACENTSDVFYSNYETAYYYFEKEGEKV